MLVSEIVKKAVTLASEINKKNMSKSFRDAMYMAARECYKNDLGVTFAEFMSLMGREAARRYNKVKLANTVRQMALNI